MSKTFTKLDDGITDSTIWMEDSDTRVVWITLLAMADWDGYVGASVPGIANRSRVSLEAAERAIAKFLGPDPHSRNKTNEGRRIAEAHRGFNILNFADFRDRQMAEARRLYFRQKKREQRGNVQDASGTKLDKSTMSTHSDSDSDSDSDRDGDRDRNRSPDSLELFADEPSKPPPRVLVTFPCSGKASAWGFDELAAAGLAGAFPGLDVEGEARKALAWIQANPTRRKTARGMPRFVYGWMERARNSGRGGAGGYGAQARDDRTTETLRNWVAEKEAASHGK